MRTSSQRKDWAHWTVAITGMNTRPDNPGPGYPVARCLQESGVFKGAIIGLGYDVMDSSLYNRRISNNGFLLPYPSSGPESLWDRLSEIFAENPVDAIIPCLDSELLNFMMIEERLLAQGISLLIPDRAMFMARNKDCLPELCRRVGVKTPACERITDPSYFYRCEEQGHSYPLVIKGIFCDAYVVHSPQEARTRYDQIIAQWGYPALVQSLIHGNEYNLVSIGDGKGNMIGSVSMRKRALTEKGKAWAGISTLDPDLHEAAAKLIKELKWRGPLEVEAIRDQQGNTHLIEINPRFPSWVYLSQGVGRNLPVVLLQLMAGESDFNLAPLQAGKMFIRYAEELIVDLDALENITMYGKAVTKDSDEAKFTQGNSDD